MSSHGQCLLLRGGAANTDTLGYGRATGGMDLHVGMLESGGVDNKRAAVSLGYALQL